MENQQQPIQSFYKGMEKDFNPSMAKEGVWTHARNLINQSGTGDYMVVGNEPANINCANLPYTLIGAIPLEADTFCVFTTNNVSSEIGILDSSTCSYTKLVNDPCLNFHTNNLITGVSRRNYKCGFNVYWSDGARNPDRVIDTSKVPWIQNCVKTGDCYTCTDTTTLDCDKLRIAPLLTIPCLELTKSTGSGQLLNGQYQVCIAYMINGVKVTDYLTFSNSISLFDHTGVGGAVTLNISNADIDFTEMEVVIVSFINSNLVAKRLGVYSTHETTINIDYINNALPTIDLTLLPIQNPAIEKSDSIWSVSNYLIRNGIYTKPDFNYQPFANNINANWVLVEYPEDYYRKGGKNVSYLRDEQYAFFIRFIYQDGTKSASYHIPGRAYDSSIDTTWVNGINTYQIDTVGGSTTDDDGTILATGRMGYWESTEIYPDNNNTVWDSLCGTSIRHHKFPDQSDNGIATGGLLSHFGTANQTIRILGVQFNNIVHPTDVNGNYITDIVGYEILRGSREGNKSIIAKGMFNNMRVYDVYGTNQKGLYQNYPYNDLRPDYYLTSDRGLIDSGRANADYSNPLTEYKQDMFSFHSPDTQFQHPYLGKPYTKIVQEIYGQSLGYFQAPFKHPMFKIPSNLTSTISAVVGVLAAVAPLIGGLSGYDVKLEGTDDIPWSVPVYLNPNYPSDATGALSVFQQALVWTYNIAMAAILMPIQIAVVQEQILRLISGLIPAHQFASQFNSHALYDHAKEVHEIRTVDDYEYVEGQLSSFKDYEVNNLYRNGYVLLQLNNTLPDPGTISTVIDETRYLLHDVNSSKLDERPNLKDTVSYYGALKQDFKSQYGQIESIKQIPIGCVNTSTPGYIMSTGVIFGGDTYINRYTEKNPFFFFNQWLFDVPTDYAYDYRYYMNVPFPRFWVDNKKTYADHFLASASEYRHLDIRGTSGSGFYVNQGAFYIFNNGVRDFFCESEVNVGYRDWEDSVEGRFYDPYTFTNLDYMFRSDYIKNNVLYKYDYSLSASKFWSQYISFSSVLSRDFDPYLAESCYKYYPRRVMYSLPQDLELKKDNWRSFLPNNYKDFICPVSAIKEIHKTGAIFFLEEASPLEFRGVDTLTTTGNMKITIGDGGLFNQSLQSITNTDKALQYGATKSKYAMTNTPFGIFWVSQEAGKIFRYNSEGIVDITDNGMKSWFNRYLSSYLLKQVPDFAEYDNPVTGVGMQMVYDNTLHILYITKKDYRIKDGVTLEYDTTNGFYLPGPTVCPIGFTYDSGTGLCCFDLVPEGGSPNCMPPTSSKIFVEVGDPNYFDDCSWTVSYDCKFQNWLSFHDWHPNFVVPTQKHFLTIKNITSYIDIKKVVKSSVYNHNSRTDKYCEFYGKSYPFEIAYPLSTGSTNTTLRNVEYRLESYLYKNNEWDRTQIYDNNFDKAIVWNDEQNSGWLVLNPKSTNPITDLAYPIVTLSSTQILYNKKENLYRFNQFYDLTNNRGEYIPVGTEMFQTDWNGYTFQLNPTYLDPGKSQLEYKKFRNYANQLFLKKSVSDQFKMLLFFGKFNSQISNR